MARFLSQQLIREVIEATDIVRVVSEYVPLKKKGKDYVALCPFHQEKTPSFSVSAAKQLFKCFGCGAGGDAIGFLMKHERMTFGEAVRTLAERAGIQVRYEGGGPAPDTRARDALYQVCEWAADEFHRQLTATPAGQEAAAYLRRRGLSDETVEQFRLGFAPDRWDHLLALGARRKFDGRLLEEAGLAIPRQESEGRYDRFRNRAMFPICDVRGRVVAFGGRTLGDDTPKYLNSPETPLFSKSRTLYGLDRARPAIETAGRAVIVEGYMDLLMAHQHGFAMTVATLGTALTEAHLQLLRRYGDSVVLVFDADTAGRAATDRSLELFLQQELEVLVCILPEEKDPCDLLAARGAAAFQQVLDGAENVFDFKLREIENRHDLRTDLGKRQAIDEALGLLAKLPARSRGAWSVRRDLVLARLAKRMGVGEAALRSRLAQMAGPRRAAGLEAAPPAADPRLQMEREAVEILVCRSDLASRLRAVMPPESIRDPALSQVARRVLAAAESGSEPLEPRAVLALVAEDGLGHLVTDLAAEGEAKGRFEERLAALADRLARESARGRRALLRAQLARSRSVEERAAILSELHRLAGPPTPPAETSTVQE